MSKALENLTVEYLNGYEKYRLWNYNYEQWFIYKSNLIEACLQIKDRFTFTTYGTKSLVLDFKKVWLELGIGGNIDE